MEGEGVAAHKRFHLCSNPFLEKPKKLVGD